MLRCDESELSYWDSEMVERRRVALQAWADYVKPRKSTSGVISEEAESRDVMRQS